MRRRGAASERGIAEEGDPEALHEGGGGEARGQRDMPSASTISTAISGAATPMPGSRAWKSSHSLKKPFSGGSPAIANSADQEAGRGPPHPANEPAVPVHVPRAGGVEDRSSFADREALPGVLRDSLHGDYTDLG